MINQLKWARGCMITVMILAAWTVNVYGQKIIKKWNGFLQQYEYYDEDGNEIAIEKYNDFLQQWEYTPEQQVQPRYKPLPYIEPYDTDFLMKLAIEKQREYDRAYNNRQRAIIEAYKARQQTILAQQQAALKAKEEQEEEAEQKRKSYNAELQRLLKIRDDYTIPKGYLLFYTTDKESKTIYVDGFLWGKLTKYYPITPDPFELIKAKQRDLDAMIMAYDTPRTVNVRIESQSGTWSWNIKILANSYRAIRIVGDKIYNDGTVLYRNKIRL
jgi:hypothetical protein